MASIEKRKDSFLIVASTGYDSQGRKRRKTMTWKPEPGMTPRQIEKELQRQAVLFEEKVSSGLHLDATTKFGDFAEKGCLTTPRNSTKAQPFRRTARL